MTKFDFHTSQQNRQDDDGDVSQQKERKKHTWQNDGMG